MPPHKKRPKPRARVSRSPSKTTMMAPEPSGVTIVPPSPSAASQNNHPARAHAARQASVGPLTFAWSAARTQAYNFFLKEDHGPAYAQQKQAFIHATQAVQRSMRDSGLFSYEGIDYTDCITPQFFGYPTSFAVAVKSIVFRGHHWKEAVFNRTHRPRLWGQYRLQKHRDYFYAPNLFDTPPALPITGAGRKERFPVAMICNIESFLGPLQALCAAFAKQRTPVLLIVPRVSQQWKRLHTAEFTELTNVRIVYFEDYCTPTEKQHLLAARAHWHTVWAHEQAILRGMFRVAHRELFGQFKPALEQLFTRYLPLVSTYHAVAKRIFNEHQVKSLIGGRPRTMLENACFMAARESKIRTTSVLHAYHYEQLDSYYDLGEINLVDYVFVLSHFDQNLFQQRLPKGSKTKVLCLGNPQMQKLYDNSLRKPLPLAALGITSPYIVYASSRNRTPKEIARVAAIARQEGFCFVIKPHPHEDASAYDSVRAPGIVVLTDSHISLYALMAHARLVVSAGSTSVLEAVLLGTPALNFEPGLSYGTNEQYFFAHYNALGIPYVKTDLELQHWIRHLTREPKTNVLATQFARFRKEYGIRATNNIPAQIAAYATGRKS